MENNLTYTRNGDYLIPDLKLSEQPEKPLGKYGRMRKAYLKEHRPILYNQLLMSEKLYPHLREIDETANSRLEQMMPRLAEAAGATEQLKASDPLQSVGLMEHLQGPGGGDPAGGTYQQLTLNLFLSEAEQIHKIDEAESVKTPSAFSMPKPAAQAEPVRRALTQAEIDAAIQEWNGNIESKHAVVRYMKDHAREKDTAAWLRQEYGDALPAFPVTADGAAGDVPWPKVQRRIAQLIKEDRFYTQEEQDRFDNIDPIAIREALAERGL